MKELQIMKKQLLRIIIAGILSITIVSVNIESEWLRIALFLISYVIVGGNIIKNAIMNIIKGKIFDENFLMTIATVEIGRASCRERV